MASDPSIPFRNPDDTIRLKSAPRTIVRRRIPGLLIAALAILLAATAGAAIGAWFALREPAFPLAGETAIFEHVATGFTIFRFKKDPLILVVDCPDLAQQGLMFDRVAALIEKSDAPKNRVLTQTQFRARLAAADLTVGTYYYGNDYSAASLRRFFRLARVAYIALTPQERTLHDIVARAGFLAHDANGAIISIPAAGPHRIIDWRSRAVILRHELAHGAYFTLPAYRAYVRHFYDTVLTGPERASFSSFLGREGYDTDDHDLIVNETIAYLVFTRDPRFFRASAIGMTDARLAALRAAFIAGMGNFWLKPMATAPLPAHR